MPRKQAVRRTFTALDAYLEKKNDPISSLSQCLQAETRCLPRVELKVQPTALQCSAGKGPGPTPAHHAAFLQCLMAALALPPRPLGQKADPIHPAGSVALHPPYRLCAPRFLCAVGLWAPCL